MKNKIIIFLIVAFVLVILITLLSNSNDNSLPPTTIPTTPMGEKFYTLAEIAPHSNASSCWVAIRANVYDLTAWINKHPGGPKAILSICGKDSTATFETQHGGQLLPEKELKNFEIGTYKK